MKSRFACEGVYWTLERGTSGKEGRRTEYRVQYRDYALERRAHAGRPGPVVPSKRNATGTTIIDLSDGRKRPSSTHVRTHLALFTQMAARY